MVVQLRGGYGDQLWAARFIPAEAARVPHLTVVMHTALLRLCRSSFATVTCVDHWPGTIALPDPDMGDAGDGAPYLRVAAPSSVLDGLHVGVCWCASGGPTDGRSVPLGALAEPLLAVPGLTLHALQQGRCTTDLSAFPDIRTYSFADFHDTAALAVTLDAVVCVDTSVAHLAGALGAPVLVAAPRWARDHRYASMRVLTYPTPGGWATPCAAAAAMIAAGDLPPRLVM